MNKKRLILFALLCLAWCGSYAQDEPTFYKIGDVYHFSDGTDGVVFSVNRDRTSGCAVAIADLAIGDAWSAGQDHVEGLEQTDNYCIILASSDGYANTVAVRRDADRAQPNVQYRYSAYPIFSKLETGSTKFSNGWYIPSQGQLRRIFSALSVMDESVFGTTTLADGPYYSSSEYPANDFQGTPNVSWRTWIVNFYTGNMGDYGAGRSSYPYKTGYTTGNYTRVVRDFPESPIYTLTVNADGNGQGRGVGGDRLIAGTVTKISALPEKGYRFDHWIDAATGQTSNTDNPRTVTVDADATYTAVFALISETYTLTVQSCDAACGSVTGGGNCAFNSTQTIRATANDGYQFVRWNDGNTENPRTVTVTEDATYTAAFAEEGAHVYIGDVLCSNGVTVRPEDYAGYKATHAGVTAKGIVFCVLDTDGTFQHGYVHDLKAIFWNWGARQLDLPNLANNNTWVDLNGAENTDKIIEYYGDVSYAAKLCRDKGKEWYLPAAGQCNYLYAQIPELQASLNVVAETDGDDAVVLWWTTASSDNRLHSSSENGANHSSGISHQGRNEATWKVSGHIVRAVCDF